jgi:dienelactone hydrolase
MAVGRAGVAVLLVVAAACGRGGAASPARADTAPASTAAGGSTGAPAGAAAGGSTGATGRTAAGGSAGAPGGTATSGSGGGTGIVGVAPRAAPPTLPRFEIEGRFRPVQFDLAAARATNDLGLTEMPGTERTVDGVRVREIRYTSLTWDATGRKHPIRLQGFVAIPPGAYPPHTKPAVILAHGLGWHGTPEEAIEVCRNIDVVALSISAPGLGASEGKGLTPEDSRPLFATVPDVRQSWLYAYVFALLRAITVVQALPQTDPRGVVLSGISMGGVASLIAGGVDDRVRGVMALEASGGFEQSERQGSWWRRLVASAAGLKPGDPAAQALFKSLDPLGYVPRAHGAVYMVVGAQDEFFPIDRVVETYEAIRAPAKSLEVVTDYDHSWYFGHGCPAPCMPGMKGPRPKECPAAPVCPARCPPRARPPYCGPQGSYNNHDNFIPRWALLLRALVARHAVAPPRPFSPPPGLPTVERTPRDIVVRTAPGPVPKAVRLAYSDNHGYTYGQVTLTRGPDGAYHLGRGLPRKVSLFIAEVEADDGAVATSIPLLPRDYKPPARPFGPLPADKP